MEPIKLVDLNPRWNTLENGGPTLGLTWLCPLCKTKRVGVAFHHQGHELIDDEYIKAHSSSTNNIWTMIGDSFLNLTLSPSVDTSTAPNSCCKWHGFVKEGIVT
jgi:hypothetical protein